ncbi:MAG: prepilin-type N-terminal cleavage/methylation domain-containing protein [Armatimonadota bacterium]
MKNLRIGNKGFTLVELLIVIIIIAVLAAIAIPKFANSSLRSKESALRGNLRLTRDAIDLFKADTGAFPTVLADLAVTTAPANGIDSTGTSKAIAATDWRGPYLQAVSPDPTNAGALGYTVSGANTGKVTANNTGTATDGTLYSTW